MQSKRNTLVITYDEAYAQFDEREVRIPSMISYDKRIRGSYRAFRVFSFIY